MTAGLGGHFRPLGFFSKAFGEAPGMADVPPVASFRYQVCQVGQCLLGLGVFFIELAFRVSLGPKGCWLFCLARYRSS